MSKQVLFIQGGGAGVHDEWDNKLVESLARELGPIYEISYPRMPDEADPTYAAWKAALEQQIAALDDGAILIGHSLGGTFLINALAENPPDRKLSGVFLIAATVSFDHRMVDGAPAARFTERFKELIESGYGLPLDEEAIAEPIARQRVPEPVAPAG